MQRVEVNIVYHTFCRLSPPKLLNYYVPGKARGQVVRRICVVVLRLAHSVSFHRAKEVIVRSAGSQVVREIAVIVLRLAHSVSSVSADKSCVFICGIDLSLTRSVSFCCAQVVRRLASYSRLRFN